MCRKLIYIISFVAVLGMGLTSVVEAADPDLVGYWNFDEGSGTTAFDSSGNGNDGVFVGDPKWVPGKLGGALEFNGDDYLDCGNNPSLEIRDAITIAFWFKVDAFQNTWEAFISKGDSAYRASRGGGSGNGTHMGISGTTASPSYFNGPTIVTGGDWHHYAGTYDGTEARIYIDGVVDVIYPSTGQIAIETDPLWIANNSQNTNRQLHGLMDDVRLYSRALRDVEILGIMAGGGAEYPLASGPTPPDGAMLEATWVNISWRAGDFAVSHDVYLSDSFDDVNNGAEGAFQGNLGTTSLIAGFAGFAFPDGLVPGTTYYWRVDEINDADPNSPWKGDVWSFWVPPKKAYEAVPADEGQFIPADVTLEWTAGFNAKLHTVYFGDSFDDVNNASGGAAQATTTFAPGTLELDKTYYWRVDEFDPPATHKGDVWSFSTIPVVPLHSDPDLVAWWTFDEGQGTTAIDWSGHGNHAMLFGSEWVAPAVLGDTGLKIGDYGAIQNLSYAATDLTEITVTAWVRTSSSADQYIVSFDRNEYYRLEINGSGGGPGQVGWDVMTSSGQVDYGSISRVDDGAWHHITGVYDKGRLTIYVDGIAEPSATGGPTYGSGNTRFGFIGANSEAGGFNSPTPGGSPVAGEVDDIRIYHRALTQEEIVMVMRGDPLLAWSPSPAKGSTPDINNVLPLTWSPGEKASQHDVYFGADADAVKDADTSDTTGVYRGRQSGTSFTPAEGVEWGAGPFYWRIDENNTDGTVSKGRVWSFTVADFLLVDDFESYDNVDPAPGEPGLNRIFDKWIDGFGTLTNGALVGNDLPPYAERTVVHSGAQSMIYRYDNAGKTSEATLSLVYPRDWTEEGVTKLSLCFNGDSGNSADRMFVALGNATVYHPDPAATQIPGWNEWVIDLTEFAGANLTNVGAITIGVGTKNSPAAGGSGTMYFDDIRLVR